MSFHLPAAFILAVVLWIESGTAQCQWGAMFTSTSSCMVEHRQALRHTWQSRGMR